MCEINMIANNKFSNEIDNIRTDLISACNIKTRLFSVEELDNFYWNNSVYLKIFNNFIYHNFIPNVDENIIEFQSIVDFLDFDIKKNRLYAIIPYINYGFNLLNETFSGYMKNKFLANSLSNLNISKYITINNEYFSIGDYFSNCKVENVNIIPDLFKNISEKDQKICLFLRERDYYLNKIEFKKSILVNDYDKNESDRCVIFLPILKYYEELKYIIEVYLKNSSVEIVTLGIYPEPELFLLLNNNNIKNIVTSDVIPLQSDYRSFSKINLIQSAYKINDVISNINSFTQEG